MNNIESRTPTHTERFNVSSLGDKDRRITCESFKKHGLVVNSILEGTKGNAAACTLVIELDLSAFPTEKHDSKVELFRDEVHDKIDRMRPSSVPVYHGQTARVSGTSRRDAQYSNRTGATGAS